MNNRRSFLVGAAALRCSLGANDRIRLGIIGFGARGKEIVHSAMQCPNTEFVGFADVFTERLKEATAVAPQAKTYLDYRRLLDDRSLDAVLIATPQHLHREHTSSLLSKPASTFIRKRLSPLLSRMLRRCGKRTSAHRSWSSRWGISGAALPTWSSRWIC